ncbi:glycosyltransferase [Methylobacterium sp. Leaf112]|uniref:glycosyltransferase n=1 Tax=Methylobacterium sp. Leaf112 TaxID=1736258 RepID=UPI000700BD58|nr:glycosyltransferase [Methylobacterium sp. Leaf112]KQP58354.1 hypothetical protein ASF52_14830 [Methylobacterium sp. Leaf112]
MRQKAYSFFSIRSRRIQKLFDPGYYTAQYPDVSDYGGGPLDHYLRHGFREGRDPAPNFSTLYYKDRYLKTAGIERNPLEAHVESGAARAGRQTWPATPEAFHAVQADVVRPYFDARYYGSLTGIVDPETALLDYLAVGWRRGLDPRPDFDGTAYLHAHPQVRLLNVSPFYHYVSTNTAPAFGQAHGDRTPLSDIVAAIRPEFDAAHYRASYADVAASGMDPATHYASHGWKEGRDPTELFWTSYYVRTNPDLILSGTNPFFHYLRFGRAEGRKPNPLGNTKWPPTRAPSAAEWDAVPAAAALDAARVVVVVPVYKGYDETLRALHAVLAEPQAAPFALLVLNDRSPDAPLTDALRALAARGLFTYYENPTNLGFVGTINRALDMTGARDVILLNSDTIVFGDWIDRLLAHAARDPRVGTITPFSNNATICSYPDSDRNNTVALELSPRALDAGAAAANAGRWVEVPTGVGFCFYMRGSLIAQLGPLDADAFGKGYGEENDYCMRVLKAGGRNILAADVFVYHSGKVSFSEVYDSEYTQGQAALLAKHPDYTLRIERFVATDPAADVRLNLDLYRLARAAGPRAAVFVVHAKGGGASVHADHLAGRLADEGVRVVTLTVTEGAYVEVGLFGAEGPYTPSLRALSVHDDYRILARFLSWLGPLFIHVHSFYGLDGTAVPVLMDLIEAAPGQTVVTLHDYSSVCLRNHLVTREGLYCGLPGGRPCADCDCAEARPGQDRMARYGAFYRAADRLLAPSQDVATRIEAIFGPLAITVAPHEEDLPTPAPRAAPRGGSVRRIGVLGAIGAHKGSNVIHALARDARRRGLAIDFTIVGYSDIPQKMDAIGIAETGRYAGSEEALALLAQHEIDLILIPSIWPETYCYTLSIALVSGLPVAVFDLGAPADRLRAAGAGHCLDPALANDPGRLNDCLLSLDLSDTSSAKVPTNIRFASYRSLLRDYYSVTGDDKAAPPPRAKDITA